MKEILSKLTSYNIFNYMLPGIVFAIITQEYIGYQIIRENLFEAAFLYYFIGLLISRFGALVIAPILRKIKIVPYRKYESFITASKKDVKIDELSEANNMYRTLISLNLSILLAYGYKQLTQLLTFSEETLFLIGIVILVFVFIITYARQSKFIVKRVDKAIADESD